MERMVEDGRFELLLESRISLRLCNLRPKRSSIPPTCSNTLLGLRDLRNEVVEEAEGGVLIEGVGVDGVLGSNAREN